MFSSADFKVEELKFQHLEDMINRVKINDCGRDVTKRWYVDYCVLDKHTQKQERKRSYGYINKEKDPEKRYTLLLGLQDEVRASIRSELTEDLKIILPTGRTGFSIKYYILEYCRQKEKSLKPTSYKRVSVSLTCFKDYLVEKNILDKHPAYFRKDLLNQFKRDLVGIMSNRTVNNRMSDLSTFFNYLINNYDDVIIKNPCSGLEKLPSRSESHVAYTSKQVKDISAFLEKRDKTLLNFCRFVGLGFLRPTEAINLKIKNIDFTRRTITISAKWGKSTRRVTKKMMDVFYEHVKKMNLEDKNPEHYVFTITGRPGPHKVCDDLFRDRYRKFKKKLGLTKLHTIYGFRHSFVCELLDSDAPWVEIMKYTGHTSMAAFEKYARSIMTKPAKDLSHHIKMRL